MHSESSILKILACYSWLIITTHKREAWLDSAKNRNARTNIYIKGQEGALAPNLIGAIQISIATHMLNIMQVLGWIKACGSVVEGTVWGC